MPKGRAILRKLVVWWLVFAPVAGFAASGDEFYQRLYERGMAHFSSGNYAMAFTELRNAAFGFAEQIEKFEIAQTYAAIAAHRLGHDADARDALLRIAAAEKIQPHFRSIKIPADLRVEVDATAATLLTSQEATLLGVSEKVQNAPAAGRPPVTVPTPTKRPDVAITAPRAAGDVDAAPLDAEPRPAAPQPPQPVAPAPRPVTPSPQPAAPPQSAAPQPRPAPVPRHADPVPEPVATTPRPVAPTPQPVATTPQPAKPVAQPKPATKQPLTPVPQPQPPVVQPAPVRTPQPVVPQPVVTTTTPASQPAQRNAEASLAEAQRAVDDGDLARARSIYNALLRGPQLPHAAGLRLAEGLYRVRDFAGAARAFQRAGTVGRGEERYHYYYAVALYETGHYGDAKRELAASLPFMTATADVAHYRAKIEGAIE
ncbi:MAG: hypothetical protein M3P29_05180 [Acidobacteriota bacterium]|nr:hypothetical protein [Acidobacteriota bacterium]